MDLKNIVNKPAIYGFVNYHCAELEIGAIDMEMSNMTGGIETWSAPQIKQVPWVNFYQSQLKHATLSPKCIMSWNI